MGVRAAGRTDRIIAPREAVGRVGTMLVRAAMLVLVVALPIVVSPWGLDAYGAIKAAVTRALAGTVLLGWGAAWAGRRAPRWRPTLAEIPLWGYVLALLASSATSVSPQLTFFGGPLRHEGLLIVGSYVVCYLAGVHFFGSSRGVMSLIVPAAAAGTIAIAYALVQPFVPPLFEGEAFTRQQYSGWGMRRVSSTVGGPVTFGGYLAFILPLVSALAAGFHRRRRLWALAGAGAVVVLALTLTRAAWAAACSGVAALFAAAREARLDRGASLALAASAVLAAVLLLTVASTPATVTSRITSAVDPSSGSLAQHLYIWERTVSLIRERPLLGWGLETLRDVFPYDRPTLVRTFGSRPVVIDRAHNDMLQVAVSVGIPGAVAYAIFWFLVLAAGVRLLGTVEGPERVLAAGTSAAILAYLVQAQFSFSSVSVTPVVWLLAGALSGWSAGARPRPPAPGES